MWVKRHRPASAAFLWVGTIICATIIGNKDMWQSEGVTIAMGLLVVAFQLNLALGGEPHWLPAEQGEAPRETQQGAA